MNLKDVDIFFNYHTHTNRNGHGSSAPDEDYVIEAMKAGVRILGFSEHCPYKDELVSDQSTVRMRYDQIEEYFSSLNRLKEKYKGQCDILIGFECEYYANHLDDVKELKKIADFILLGQHFNTIDKKEFHSFTMKCDDEEAKLYADYICAGLETGLYDYLAHPDYFYGGTYDIDEVFIESSHRICKKCEETKTPLEINLNGNAWYAGIRNYKQGRHYHYPNRIFWDIASKYDVKCIIGYDAHDPALFSQKETLLNNFSSEIDDLGLNIITEPLFK